MNYRMFSYVTKELPLLISSNFPADPSLMSIMGHRYQKKLFRKWRRFSHCKFCYSMGGHGALICALKNPGLYKSVSAFAPICNPVNCPWGEKAFSGYLGSDKNLWKEWDASCLAATYQGPPLQIFVDQVMVFKICSSTQHNFTKIIRVKKTNFSRTGNSFPTTWSNLVPKPACQSFYGSRLDTTIATTSLQPTLKIILLTMQSSSNKVRKTCLNSSSQCRFVCVY